VAKRRSNGPKSTRALEPSANPAWIYGIHAVSALLDTHGANIHGVWLLASRQDARLHALQARAAELGIACQTVAPDWFAQQLPPDANHQGVAASYPPPPLLDEPTLYHLIEQTASPLVLLLDGVTDPHNLGACLRTADAAGVSAVVMPKDRAAGISPTVRKVASGAAESVPCAQVTNLARCLRRLQQAGLWLVGLDGEAEQSLFELDMSGPLGLVLGAEGHGLRRLTRTHCDYLAALPMRGRVESLNISVATGISLYEALRQRGPNAL